MQIADDDAEEAHKPGKKGMSKLLEYQPGARDQSENKETFRKNYGVEIKLPSVYVIDAEIYPDNFNYILKIVKYQTPKTEQMVITYPNICNPKSEIKI